MSRSELLAVSVLIVGGLLGIAPVPAHAQQTTTRSAELDAPYVAVGEDGAALRCGAGTTWYVVDRLKPGVLLRVEGEEDNWLRVEYPRGMSAVVKAHEGEHDPEKGTVTLTRNSALWALDDTDPYIESCYKRIFREKLLTAGTTLKYVGPVQDRRGNLAGFEVEAPRGATGYVLPADVRQATEQELQALRAARAAEKVSLPQDPAEELAETQGETEQIREEPAATPPAPRTRVEVVETEVIEEEPYTEPAAPASATDLASQDATLDDLDEAFARLQRQSLEEAEFGPLIDEYTALRERLPDEPGTDVTRAYIDARIELLTMRSEVQDKLRRLAAVREESKTARAELDALVASMTDAQSYTAVGRLMPSAIYNGNRLPRMYRVQSIGSGGRTIAYVLPGPDMPLEGMLGSIVGVRGMMEAETSARVRVIRPETVDLLRSGAAAAEVEQR
ncbi:MAG: SH3 domain-containing protein [Planctomycetota bacterium]